LPAIRCPALNLDNVPAAAPVAVRVEEVEVVAEEAVAQVEEGDLVARVEVVVGPEVAVAAGAGRAAVGPVVRAEALAAVEGVEEARAVPVQEAAVVQVARAETLRSTSTIR